MITGTVHDQLTKEGTGPGGQTEQEPITTEINPETDDAIQEMKEGAAEKGDQNGV